MYSPTFSVFADGTLAEIFLSNGKVGSDSDAAARDSTVVCSIALQHGTPVDALLRDPRSVASSPLSIALDLLSSSEDRR
jgi:hypothetical protein